MHRQGRFFAKCIYSFKPTVSYTYVLENPNCRKHVLRSVNTVVGVQQTGNGFEIAAPSQSKYESDTNPLFVDYMWLRDHCQCPKCYNWKTYQRETGPERIDAKIKPHAWTLEAGDNLSVEWPDHHQSTYSLKWLCDNVFGYDRNRTKPAIKLWNKCLPIADYPHVKYIEETDSVIFAHQVLSNLITFGFCLVHEVSPNIEKIRSICEKIAPIQVNFWGDMWTVEVAADSTPDGSDTAFSNVELPPHTDCTYLTESPGLQIFSRFDTTAIGGETVLVDGFNAATQLKSKHPDSYEYLSKTPIESSYADNSGRFYSHYDTVLRHIPSTTDLLQIRFNPLDLAPLKHIPQEDIRNYYKSYSRLSNEINDESSKITLALNTGTMLIFNNWRVLHARKSFTGNRVIGGCYIGRADFYSKAKQLRLI